MIEHADYRVVLVLPNSRQVLGVAGQFAIELPILRIPRWTRPAEQLTKQIEQRWKIGTIVLEILCASAMNTPCAVIEVRTNPWDYASEGFCPTCLTGISARSLAEDERHILDRILSGNDAGTNVFSRVGWVEDAQRWIQSNVTDHEVVFSGKIRQLNGGGRFCLLRLGTEAGPDYWIKGVGGENAQEFAITGYLAAHCREFLPPVIAMRADWNAWAMEEFGASLRASGSFQNLRRAVCRLVQLQKGLMGRAEELLSAGCTDHRIVTLDGQIDPIMEYLDGAMRQQASTRAAPLATSRLQEIGEHLHRACLTLESLEIPDSLMHGDLSPGSILVHGGDCVFTDWCEARVGNPFLSFEQFCAFVARADGVRSSWIHALKDDYYSLWTDVLSQESIYSARRFLPLLALLSYLYGRGDWLRASWRHEPAVQSYARSLARHLDRMAADTGPSEVLCPAT